jgi:hypothetical protein
MTASNLAVVDTNVGIAANLKADVSPECALDCIQLLRAITRRGHLVLDANGLIFSEYRKYLSLAGEPGTGDAFVRWVADHQFDVEMCTRIELTATEDGNFAEFPDGEGLESFDDADRKFVSVSAAHTDRPAVHVAVDRGWVKHAAALAAVGVTVNFLCPGDVAEHHKRRPSAA